MEPGTGVAAPDLIGDEDAAPSATIELPESAEAAASKSEPGITEPDLIGDRP